MTKWYYSDYERNRHGPVSADDLAELHANGQLAPDTLVWREGLSQWQPWRQLMGEVVSGAGRPAAASATFATAPATAAPGASADPYTVAEPASPYAPPRAALLDSDEYVDGGEVVYAGFWKRTAAYIIDSFVLMIIIGILGAIFAVFGLAGMASLGDPSAFSSGAGMALILGFYLVEIVVMALYYAMFHASSRQATLGKMAVGIKVTDDEGRRISFARGIGRFLAFILSSFTILIGFVMAAFTQRKRALHDMIASTLVVDQWAYTAHPDRQRPELGTVTVVMLVLGAVLALGYIVLIVAMVGLAAAAGGA
ncbi:MAG TPA: RDD family protein [Lysobacter sp.]